MARKEEMESAVLKPAHKDQVSMARKPKRSCEMVKQRKIVSPFQEQYQFVAGACGAMRKSAKCRAQPVPRGGGNANEKHLLFPLATNCSHLAEWGNLPPS